MTPGERYRRCAVFVADVNVDPDTGRFVERPQKPPRAGELAKWRRNRRRIEMAEERARLRDSLDWLDGPV